MSKYINYTKAGHMGAHGKAGALMQHEGAIPMQVIVWPPEPGRVFVCVVNNGPFEAARIVDDRRNFERFSDNDGRPKIWFTMDAKRAEELGSMGF